MTHEEIAALIDKSGKTLAHCHAMVEDIHDMLDYLKAKLAPVQAYTCAGCTKPLTFPQVFYWEGVTYCAECLPGYNQESEGW